MSIISCSRFRNFHGGVFNIGLLGAVVSILFYLLVNLYAHFEYVPLNIFFMDNITQLRRFASNSFFDNVIAGCYGASGPGCVALKPRPVAYLFMYIGIKMMGTNTSYAYLYLLFFGALSCLVVYYVAKSITCNLFCAIAASAIFAVSRFAYYAVGDYWGLMETIALTNGILVFYYAYRYLISNEGTETKSFWIMIIFEVLAILSHERCLMLFFFIYSVVFIKYFFQKKSLVYYIPITVLFVSIILFRFWYLGNQAMEGTGGEHLTFNLSRIIKFFVEGSTMILGFAAGEAYLSGVVVEEVKGLYFILPLCSICIIYSLFGVIFFQSAEIRRKNKILFLFLSFIVFSLLAGCITFRLELRWLYLPYVGYLMLVFYLLSQIKQHTKIRILLICYLFCSSFYVEAWYRTHWVYNYLGNQYGIYNQIYDSSIGKYGNAMAQRPLVIVENIDNGTTVVEHTWMKWILDYYTDNKNAGLYFYNHFQDIPNEVNYKHPIVIYGEQTAGNIWQKTFFDVSNIYQKLRD